MQNLLNVASHISSYVKNSSLNITVSKTQVKVAPKAAISVGAK